MRGGAELVLEKFAEGGEESIPVQDLRPLILNRAVVSR